MSMQASPPRLVAPLLHRFLGMGLAMLVVAFFVLRYVSESPLAPTDILTPVIGYTVSGLAFALLAVSFLVLKPRVPERRPSQSIEEYWSTPDVTTSVFLVWFTMEGAGVLSAVSFFLTGATVSAAMMMVALAVFWTNGPSTFGK